MSNVKRKDIWTAVRTVLKKNPGIKAKELISKVREKTGLSRSTIYEHLGSFELQSKIYREKGLYFFEKPKNEKPSPEQKRGFWDYLKNRAENKRQEEERRKKEQLAEFCANAEFMASNPEWGRMWEPLKEYADTLRKTRKELALDE